MRITKGTIVLVVSMILISIFLANVVNLLSTDAEQMYTPQKNKKSPYKIDDTTDHLIWFLQITDIHISIFTDPDRITDFREFCSKTVNAIKPPVVLASGDLTDAKTRNAIGSQQFEQEWKHYRNVLEECDIRAKTAWLDIRGNHDNFNVANAESEQNFFTNYSIQGQRNPRSYMHQVKINNDLFSFIGVDACLEPGPRRPFNFIGLIDQLEIDEINKLINRTKVTRSDYNIWFGHFPTSCIISTGDEGIRKLIKKDENGVAYVCGHLHKLGGLIPQMYTLQKAGFLELELGDWKDNRVYRVMAIDHGMLSFVDVPHGRWPVALVTNPKHALFINPSKEDWNSVMESTHIRVLAFSLAKIEFVRVRINGEQWNDCYNVDGGPLYALKWSAEKYAHGLHRIEMHVKDGDGREQIYVQPFALDDTRLSFKLLARFALMTDASTIFRSMFFITLFMCTLPLVAMRICSQMFDTKQLARPKLRGNCFTAWFRKFWILTTIDRIFWPVILYPVYLSFGPWSIGYLVEDHLGVIFSWGIYVNGSYLPGSFTYAYGFIQLVTFQIPLTFILAHGVDHKFQHKVMNNAKKKGWCSRIGLHLPFILIFSTQLIMAYLFWLAYGTMAFLLGPLRTWSVILAGILWFYVIYLPDKCTRKAANQFQVNQVQVTPAETGLDDELKQ